MPFSRESVWFGRGGVRFTARERKYEQPGTAPWACRRRQVQAPTETEDANAAGPPPSPPQASSTRPQEQADHPTPPFSSLPFPSRARWNEEEEEEGRRGREQWKRASRASIRRGPQCSVWSHAGGTYHPQLWLGLRQTTWHLRSAGCRKGNQGPTEPVLVAGSIHTFCARRGGLAAKPRALAAC